MQETAFFWDVKSCRVKGTDVSEQYAVLIFGKEEGDNTFFRIVGTLCTNIHGLASRDKKSP